MPGSGAAGGSRRRNRGSWLAGQIGRSFWQNRRESEPEFAARLVVQSLPATQQFTALAEAESGVSLGHFFDLWL